MAYEHKDNSGSLFSAQKKTDNSPDKAGDCKLVCPECGYTWISRIAGWLKEGKSGTWLSLRFSTAISKAPEPQKTAQPDDDFNDYIPF